MKILSFCILLLVCVASNAQIAITDCYDKAQTNYPLIKQYDLLDKTMEYNLSNANKGYLPQVVFSAKASYQSDVAKIDLSQLGMSNINTPTLAKDQYGATLDISQTLWDGGVIKSQKETIRIASDVEKLNVGASMYAIKERINQLYFGILLADAQIGQNELLQDELKRTYDEVDSYIKNGIANQSDLNAIKIDQLKAIQNKIQFESVRKAYIEMLSKFIGEEISETTVFIKPATSKALINEIKRPELAFFDAQIKNLESQEKQISSNLMPKLGVFATGGYGRPGLNMLQDKFSTYYTAGVKLSWNIGSFYTQKNDKRKIESSINSINTQRETFLFNTELDITQKNNDIKQYKDQLEYDNQIIELRNEVKKASEVKMANGMISGTDLMRDLNAEQMAKQDKILHEIQLLLAIYNLKFATNN